MHITVKCEYEEFDHKVRFNSKFMVVALRSEYRAQYKMNIYDLEAVKKAELLAHTLAMEFDFDKIWMDETEIICENEGEIRILNFGSFECLRSEFADKNSRVP